MQIERITARGQLVPLLFMQDAVAASQTNAQLPIVETGATTGGTSVEGAIVPFAGEIVAISWKLSAAGTAGVFTLGPTVGGTEKTTLQDTVGTAASGTMTCVRGSIPVAAGDEIGVEITTDGSWDGTTSDLAVWVWVLQYIEGI